ncbi:MAG: class III poly(R)-hydroxyalkanoic acid synthase subunit PhaC [Magnetococcales bacterium]|nr:class III poly(R)-hydroxyalkanoic acid synthase subunit PhaC [Magnetococcales bacterium]MBF0113671.1 class III poly(R)-hydroxyalkanoic acid synthase subunit PhaC [Magnetococcales bacterium]
MFPINMTPQQAAEELLRFNQKLISGMDVLSATGPISAGVSSREAVYTDDKVTLYRYQPRVEKRHRVPVLVVYALVNRPYMADLQEDRSLIRGLLDEGMDVYLIDWGYPDGSDRYLTLDDYINGYIYRCVQHICEAHDLYRINLLGICQGGTFSICFSALHPEKVRNLVTTVTPVDFQTPDNLLSRWAQTLNVDLLVDTLGNIPGDLLNFTFLSMNPYRLTGQKYLDMVEIMDSPEKLKNFLRMEKWIFDSPDQAGEAFRQFIKDFYQCNGLIKGEVVIGGQRVDLKNITMPVFNVYATLDHLVPPAASKVLKDLVGSTDYSEFAFKGGHIGIYVSGRAQQEVPPAVANWLKARG